MEGEGRKRKGERDTHCSRREARKKLEKNGLHDNNWNIQRLFRKDSAGLNSADGCTDSYCTHIYRSKTHTHSHTLLSQISSSHTVRCTSFTAQFSFGEYTSPSCFPHTHVTFLYPFPAGPSLPSPVLKD